MKSGKTAGVIVAVGLAAAAAGIVVVAAIGRWHERNEQQQTLATRLRDIQDVLSDCDSKLRQIEEHMVPVPQSNTATPGFVSNGSIAAV